MISRTAKKSSGACSEQRLVKERLSGSEEAWAWLAEKYKALIYSVPVKYGLPGQEAAGVFQATCVGLRQRLPEFRGPQALATRLTLVPYHQCYRWKMQQNRLVSRDAEPNLRLPETAAIADTLVQQTQEEPMVREVLARLTRPPRPYAKAAEDSGLELGSVGFTRQKCLERLRRCLREWGFR
jgi:DNA-directed RNA polymerase specialized sigma24 family protein